MHYDFDEERYILDLPKVCPICKEKYNKEVELELDIRNYDRDETEIFLLCPNPDCDYSLDATKEFHELDRVEGERE